MPNQRLKYLFDLYIQGNCTAVEKSELYALALALKNEADVQALLDEYWDSQTIEFRMPGPKANLIADTILNHHEDKSSLRSHKVRTMIWKKLAVAASILLVIGLGSYFLFFNNNKNQDEITKTGPQDVESPTVTKATITLANGEQISLDSLTSLQQGNVKIEKTKDGQIVYNGSAATVQYNILVNPRGSKVQPLTLNDGTKVWLNAESSIRYPTAFTGTDRKVEITGEAYFEVAHNAAQPFIVSDVSRDVQVQVLGTHFNINTYSDEAVMKVTLLEGSVKVMKGSASGILKPGQQAQVSGVIKVVNGVDVEEVMAWKNGQFAFGGKDLETVMKQLSRWYDVGIQYEGAKPVANFRGSISSQESLAEVLKMLELTKAVKFRIEGKNIIVTK